MKPQLIFHLKFVNCIEAEISNSLQTASLPLTYSTSLAVDPELKPLAIQLRRYLAIYTDPIICQAKKAQILKETVLMVKKFNLC